MDPPNPRSETLIFTAPLNLKRLIQYLTSGRSKAEAACSDAQLQLELARELAELRKSLVQMMPDNPAAQGFKVYSQSDEDGVIEAICNRLKLDSGTFIEIGCGNGQENNTHYLVLKGWRGVWIDGDPSNVEFIRASVPNASHVLRVTECLVTRENVADLLRDELTALGAVQGLDLLSLDIDGNDLPVALVVTEAMSPKVLVVEYNAEVSLPVYPVH